MTAPIVPPDWPQSGQPGQREAARDHVTRLRQDGGTYRSIAAAAALSPGAVHRLASGRRRAQPGTAAAVLTVTSPALPQARLDAGGTRLRLRALHVMGHGSARIARAAGAHPQTIRKLVRGDARTVSQQLRDAIVGLYDAWWDKRAPGRTRSERAAATAARTRAMDRRLVRPRRPGRRPARHPRLPARVRLETRHRHRRRPRHPPARPPPPPEERRMSDHRIGLDLIHRRPGRAAPARATPAATTGTRAGPSSSSATWPASTKAPRTTRTGPHHPGAIPAGAARAAQP